MSEQVLLTKAEITKGVDGRNRIRLHSVQSYLTPSEALRVSREIHQYAVDAMQADGDQEVTDDSV